VPLLCLHAGCQLPSPPPVLTPTNTPHHTARRHPPAVVQYLPNFFFGALLTVFGIEIAGDWLVRSAAKVSPVEYYLLLATFVAIMQLGLEYGVAAGILMCTIYFAFRYAQVRGGAGGRGGALQLRSCSWRRRRLCPLGAPTKGPTPVVACGPRTLGHVAEPGLA
jgi:hypothetical protein